ncbi:MAG TPA: hypothetical protein VFT98_18815 [Myxococcota bacterium]|nr:hypothetical protein [Myxococcota bacterium]
MFERLEQLSEQRETVRRIFEDLHSCPAHSAAEMAELALRYGLCDESFAAHMRDHWGAGAWFGPVMDEVNVKFRRAAHLLRHASGLSAWWVRGSSARVFIEVYQQGGIVRMILHSPHLPPEYERAKA